MKTHYQKNGNNGGAYGGETACGRYIVSGLAWRLSLVHCAGYGDLADDLKPHYPAGRQRRLPECTPCKRAFLKQVGE